MLIQTVAPTTEPVSLDEAKLHLRVDSDLTADDGLIGTLITAARLHGEAETGTSFITQTWRQVLDRFPCEIVLERGPVQSIGSIVYRDMAGATQTVSFASAVNGIQRSTDATIVADLSGRVALVRPAFGCVWPIPMPETGAVAVTYTAGYGSLAAAVPAGIKQWIMLRVNTLYENREAVAILPRGRLEALPYVDGLLDPYRQPM